MFLLALIFVLYHVFELLPESRRDLLRYLELPTRVTFDILEILDLLLHNLNKLLMLR